MKIVGMEKHHMKDKYPCRLPVWWGNIGEIGAHPNVQGVTGRKVVLRIEKRFTRIEKLMARIFRAPREVRRPLDTMNSVLWELCDGKNTFEEICNYLDSTFHEDIAPVVERTKRGIEQFKSQNLVTVLDTRFNDKWEIKRGVTPPNQTLEELDPELGIDVEEE
ncbi:MAG: PqqD family protein [Candidatus Poseidoniales archaeon]|nr:MAG: PqqD family protein [Candidatus Poseidoniales archaeon]|tara:strand:+ start:4737 stop:5225 length:489 start_codon:yes stop_codon:yes gene_type:complete